MFRKLKVKTFTRGMRVITLKPNPGLIILVRILISALSVFLGRVKWVTTWTWFWAKPTRAGSGNAYLTTLN